VGAGRRRPSASSLLLRCGLLQPHTVSRKGRWTNPRSGTYPRTLHCEPFSSHCFLQCDPGPLAVRPVGLALRPRALRTATPNFSHCEACRFALRSQPVRTAKFFPRTATPGPSQCDPKLFAVRSPSVRTATQNASHCEKVDSHCENFGSARPGFRSANKISRTAKRRPFAVRPNSSHCSEQCDPGASQCDPKLFAVRGQDFRTATPGFSQCEARPFALRSPGLRTAPSSATIGAEQCDPRSSHCSEQCDPVGRCHCVGWSTGPSYHLG